MQRGETWTMARGSGYDGKPRPVLIVQDDAFTERDSVTVCLITTDPTDLPVFRIPVQRSCLGQRIGQIADDDLLRLNRSLLVFLGLAR